MKDRVRENYEFEVRFRLKELMKKIKKCASNDPFEAHLYLKSEEFVPQSEVIYYINVPQNWGR